jgi:hypothetical protein
MSITMTWADGVLALVLGIIGSIIAGYLYNRLPALSNAVSQWLSRRSQKATEARLRRLRLQLEEVETFKSDTAKYLGWMLNTLSHAQMNSTLTIVFLVISSGMLVSAAILIDSVLAFFAKIGFGFAIGTLVIANIFRARLKVRSDLQQREAELRREIEKGQRRLIR